jgi:hypothetical protein
VHENLYQTKQKPMTKKIFKILVGVIVVWIGFISCENDENETLISSYNSTESHNSGQNCMSCHRSGGSGEGLFTVAGTVYDSTRTSIFPNATIRLFTRPNGAGTLEAIIEVDGLGNFYTTEAVDFESGLYTSTEGSLETKFMNSPITTGNCNSCHGVSTDRIWTR